MDQVTTKSRLWISRAKAEAMIPTGNAINPYPMSITTAPTILPRLLIGTTSPYPTVVHRGDGPVNAMQDAAEFLRLVIVFNQIHQRGSHQDHAEDDHAGPDECLAFCRDSGNERAERRGISSELQEPQQTEDDNHRYGLVWQNQNKNQWQSTYQVDNCIWMKRIAQPGSDRTVAAHRWVKIRHIESQDVFDQKNDAGAELQKTLDAGRTCPGFPALSPRRQTRHLPQSGRSENCAGFARQDGVLPGIFKHFVECAFKIMAGHRLSCLQWTELSKDIAEVSNCAK